MTTQQTLQARLLAFEAEMDLLEIKGGRGSGNWGHAGRPGKRGGSSSRGGAMSQPGAMAPVDRQAAVDEATRQELREAEAALRNADSDAGVESKLGAIGSGGPAVGKPVNNEKATVMMAAGVELEEYGNIESYPSELIKNNSFATGADQLTHATQKSREQAKLEIVNALAERSGLPPATVDKMVHQWAMSSADHDPESLALQRTAAALLGRPVPEYVAKRLAMEEKHGNAPRLAENDRRAFIKAMYDHTQAQFAAAGLKPTDTVRVYRGVRGELTEPNKMASGATVELAQNAMTSWSLSKRVAREFAGNAFSFGDCVLSMDVPVSAIIGTCRTGVGCLVEAEVVVADTGQHRATAESKY